MVDLVVDEIDEQALTGFFGTVDASLNCPAPIAPSFAIFSKILWPRYLFMGTSSTLL